MCLTIPKKVIDIKKDSVIVEDHNGWIHVESELEEGACFIIYLPMDIDIDR